MSVLTAIFQAIFQALCWIFPISESAHSAIFHDFSDRLSGANSSLTGVVHIGIALGILVALHKMFFALLKDAFVSLSARTKSKQGSGHAESKSSRSFMLMSLISLVPMLFLFIPIGEGRFLYDFFRTSQHNGILLDDGVFLVLTGALVLLVSKKLSLSANNKNISVVMAVLVGIAGIFLVSVSGLSLIMGVMAILVLMNASKKSSFRYAMVLSVPVLFVMGVAEIITAVTMVDGLSAVIGVVIAALISFFSVRFLKTLIYKNNIKFFGVYDVALGVLIMIIGIFELI